MIRSKNSWPYAVWVLLFVGLCDLAQTTWGFDSYGLPGVNAGAIHDRITLDATRRIKLETCGQLQSAVRLPDWEQSKIYRMQLRTNDLYSANNHFDRGVDRSHEEAFAAGALFTRLERQKCLHLVKTGKQAAAIVSLGRVLHAVQDLASHSNLCDLTAAEVQTVYETIWKDEAKLIVPLRITGFDPNGKTPGEPVDDRYSHDSFSKDNPSKNEEAKSLLASRTKFEVAYAIAVDYSEKVLRDLQADLGKDWQPLETQLK